MKRTHRTKRNENGTIITADGRLPQHVQHSGEAQESFFGYNHTDA